MASCPLHRDDTPSVSVRPSKGAWKCFSCNMGGDAVALVMKVEGIGFREACKKLIENYEIPPPARMVRDEFRERVNNLEKSGDTKAAIELLKEKKWKS